MSAAATEPSSHVDGTGGFGETEGGFAQRALEDLVAMSTIGVDIRSTTVEGPTGTPSFWDGLVAGWGAFLAWGAAALFALGQAVPTLIVLAVLGLVVWLIVRRALRRRPQRATVAGPAVENPATPAPVE